MCDKAADCCLQRFFNQGFEVKTAPVKYVDGSIRELYWRVICKSILDYFLSHPVVIIKSKVYFIVGIVSFSHVINIMCVDI